MNAPKTKMIQRLVAGLKTALILTVYFCLCVLIILVVIGARR